MKQLDINDEVRSNAVEIYAGLEVEDGKPYRPANGTEGDIFCARWCSHCVVYESGEIGVFCEILTASLFRQSEEWVYWENKPVCTAFKRRKSEGS
jgi:hypothetical protein